MNLLAGKVAIVTGAARGIGEAIAIKFAEHGANIAFTFISDSSKDKAAAL
jgi:3-oxoacyl-[acyl-carrier protein] reductase